QPPGGRGPRGHRAGRHGPRADGLGHHRTRARGDRTARRRPLHGRGGARLVLRQAQDGFAVRWHHHPDPRAGRSPGVRALPSPLRGRPLGHAGSHGAVGRRLLLPVLPQGGPARDHQGPGTLAVWALGLILVYLIGSLPVGFLVTRLAGGFDIRGRGSGTIGATNVMRTLGPVPAIATLLGDALKGYVAVRAAEVLGPEPSWGAAGAVLAIVGNCWPVFLRFKGGKGVATRLGALLALTPKAIPPALVVSLLLTAALLVRAVPPGGLAFRPARFPRGLLHQGDQRVAFRLPAHLCGRRGLPRSPDHVAPSRHPPSPSLGHGAPAGRASTRRMMAMGS